MSDAPIIDCDVHCTLPKLASLFPYLSEHWREYLSSTGFAPRSLNTTYPRWSPMLSGAGLESIDGFRERVFGQADRAILHCYYGLESIPHPYLAPLLASAVNDWMRDEWLAQDPRLLASAVITPQHPDAAVDEIHRVAADGRFTEVYLPARSREPYGHHSYWPIWEAAAEAGLVVGISGGGAGGSPPTPVNWMSSFFEEYAAGFLNFQAQIISLVFSGVFERWPQLRFTIAESGWVWLPGLLWRLDEEWKACQREIPWVLRPASEYVRTHFRFTTLPFDPPARPGQLREVLNQIDAAQLLLFASDHPHRYHATNDELIALLSANERELIMRDNAAAWYRHTPPTQPASSQRRVEHPGVPVPRS